MADSALSWVLSFLRITTALMRFSCHSRPHLPVQECYLKTPRRYSKKKKSSSGDTEDSLLVIPLSLLWCNIEASVNHRFFRLTVWSHGWCLSSPSRHPAHRLQQSLINAHDAACAASLQLLHYFPGFAHLAPTRVGWGGGNSRGNQSQMFPDPGMPLNCVQLQHFYL